METTKNPKSLNVDRNKSEIALALRLDNKDVNWSDIYSSMRDRSDWIKEINSKYGGIIAYWDSRASKFTHGANYYDQITSEIIKLNVKSSTLLEVGAGTGNFTLPFSPYKTKIFAVEPAPLMIKSLKQRLEAQNIKNVDVVHSSWEDVIVNKKYDTVLFSHSIYFIKNIQSAIEKAKSFAEKEIVILSIVFDPSDVFSQVSELISGQKYITMPDYTVICMALRQLGLSPEVKIVDTDTTYADYAELYSKLTNNFEKSVLNKKRAELDNLIKSHPQISPLGNGKWTVKKRFRTAIIKCEV